MKMTTIVTKTKKKTPPPIAPAIGPTSEVLEDEFTLPEDNKLAAGSINEDINVEVIVGR
jgi:hypothetical protein